MFQPPAPGGAHDHHHYRAGRARRFFTIAGRQLAAGDSAPEMFSGAIDAAWHRLAEDIDAHAEFTTVHAGRRLTHVRGAGTGHITWVAAYEEAFGPLPEVWFTNGDGTVDSAAHNRYRETGQVWASWNCSPAGGGDDVCAEPAR
ncbi:hypothetical protein [Streptomyces sp. CB01881]|uniref:hypothetical protein n=1 Tax=Streptomyces sp. CB01881 TaxID=2078691 RepID=UPI001F11A770|nr:hypothetical protein [Streptomyces sp. CB01881]